MRKILLGLCAVLMTACNSEEFSGEAVSNSSDGIRTAVIPCNGNGTSVARSAGRQTVLQFKDSLTLEKFKAELGQMSNEEKMATVGKYGITTLHELAVSADDELEDIGNTATSEEQFRILYAAYKEKYAGLLMSNTSDTTDLTLYVPDEDNVETFIGNANGLYMVGNEVVKSNVRYSLSPSILRMSNAAATDSTTPVNTFCYSPKKHKRVYFDAYLTGGTYLWVKMHCKKKMWYGWKNDPDRSYYFDSYLNNFAYLGAGKYGQEIETVRLPRYIFNKNVKNGFCINLGKLKGTAPITGLFYTWTDMTSEHDANGNDILETIEGCRVPKCMKSKAQIVNIYLK